MSNQTRALAYLSHYAQKNLADVAAMFADDIVLRDWKILVRGKVAAVHETEKNFAAAHSISIQTLHLYENDHNTVAAELKIVVNGNEELYVVDVISFNDDGKIQAIRAYLGRGDE